MGICLIILDGWDFIDLEEDKEEEEKEEEEVV